MGRNVNLIVGNLLLAAVLAGCEGSAALSRSGQESMEVSPSLVLAPVGLVGPAGVDEPAAWEAARNDRALGLDGGAGLEQWRWVEVRGVDHRWTLNGRVRESSRTTTRTLRRGILRSE